MRMILRSIIIALMCICLLIQTGCWDRKLYEEIGFILQMGLETGHGGELIYSVTSPVVAPEVKEKVEFIHTSKERLIRASRERVRDVSGKLMEGGKLQHVYFSKALAETGINEFFEIFFRNPENPLLANVIVVDGSPKEMMELSLEFEDKPRSALYVSELLADAHRSYHAPETRIYDFSILNYSETIDPVAPLFRYSKENIRVSGSALFSGDKMVGEIDTDQTMLLTALMGKKDWGEYIYEEQDSHETGKKIKRGAAMLITGSKRKVKIYTSGKVPVIDINLELKAFLHEYAGNHNLDESENKKRLEEAVARSIKADSLKLLNHLQNLGTDPIGFGEILRAKQNKYWKSVKWKEVYKDASFKMDVKMNIESYGAIN